MSLDRRGQFRSRDKDGGHTIRTAIAENLLLHANFTALSSIESELLLTIQELHCGNRDFRAFFCACDLELDPMTFIYELVPYSLKISSRPNMNILRSYLYRHTDTRVATENITTSLRG